VIDRRGWRRRPPSPWRRAAILLAVAVLLPLGALLFRSEEPARQGAPAARVEAETPSDQPSIDASSEAATPTDVPSEVAVRPGVNVPILLYHYIRVNPRPWDRVGFHLSVTPQHFAEQMQLLHDVNAHTVTLTAVLSALSGGPPLPPRSVVLTFDDGYADFATTAAPIMADLGLQGTAFVVSGFVGRPGYMSADQVRQVVAMGATIGAHTVHHWGLARLSPATARAEITDSRQQLAAITGMLPDDFAYPYGNFDTAVVQLVQEAGFRDAVSTLGGSFQSYGFRYVLHRERVGGGDTLAAFAAKTHVPLVPVHPAPVASMIAVGSTVTTSSSAEPTGPSHRRELSLLAFALPAAGASRRRR